MTKKKRVLSDMTKRVLSGMRPTGRLHLGNYLGAAAGMVELQDDPEYETLYMVANLHGITTPFDPKELKSGVRNVVLDYLAIGLDPKKSAIFAQSDLADLHTQLALYFSSVVSVARMRHLPTFKEKVKQHPEAITMALLNYPVLMAADILLYKADSVPVGIDQECHIEVSREIARKMNQKYNLDFPEPKRFATKGESVPSLTGDGKMSKSVQGSYINLTDNPETIKKKLAKVPTDSGKGGKKIKDYRKKGISVTEYTSENGEVSHGVGALMKLTELFLGSSTKTKYEKLYSTTGIRYGEMKEELAEAIFTDLKPIQKRRKELAGKPEYIDQVLEDGAKKARKIAEKTVAEVREKMGLK